MQEVIYKVKRLKNRYSSNVLKNFKLRRFLIQQVSVSIGHLCVFWQILFFYCPILFLIFQGLSALASKDVGISVSEFFSVEYLYIYINSLILSLTTTLITLVLGFCIAYTLAFHIKKHKNLILLLIIIPFWTNFALHMYSWFYILQPSGLLNTLLLNLHIISEPLNLVNSKISVYIMMCYYYLPFMLISIYTSLERFDYTLIEASKNLGARSLSTFVKIVLPLNIRGIRTGIFLVLIPSFAEFIIPELMGGDTHAYIGSVITLFTLGNATQNEGIILTFISLLFILIVAYVINIGLKRVSLLIAGKAK